jgi:hypothetical protein
VELKLRDDGLSWREIDGEVVVLDSVRSTYLTLNASGGVLWKLLQSGSTLNEMVDELTDVFDVDRAVAAADVQSFLALCHEQNLLAS